MEIIRINTMYGLVIILLLVLVVSFALVLWGWCRLILHEATSYLFWKCIAVSVGYFISFRLLTLVFPSEIGAWINTVILAFPFVSALIHYFGASLGRALLIFVLSMLSVWFLVIGMGHWLFPVMR